MHSSFMKSETECGSHKEPAVVFHDNWTVFHFSEMKLERAAHLLRRLRVEDASLHFLQENLSGKQLNGKRKEESSVPPPWGKTSSETPQQNTSGKSIKRTKDANVSSPNTLRKSWLSELPALLLARHVYGPPSPCRMFLTVSVLLPPSSAFNTYCSDRSITWPFLWTQTIGWDDWQLKTLYSLQNVMNIPVQLLCGN